MNKRVQAEVRKRSAIRSVERVDLAANLLQGILVLVPDEHIAERINVIQEEVANLDSALRNISI